MKFSMILSYYKQPVILERALHIWANQTFPKEDYEVLIMDGGKGRQAISHAQYYKRNWPNFNLRYFTYDGRIDYKCPVHAWNVGIRQARGEIIGITMEDRLTTFDAVEALYRPHEREEGIFCTVLPWLINGRPDDDIINTVNWRENPRLLWAVSRPTIIASGKKKENETVMFSLPRKTMLELGGFDERWRDYGYWMLSLYRRMMDHGLRPYEVSWIINAHHPHHRHGTMRAELYDGEARRAAWERIRDLNNHGVFANVDNPDWGAMDGDEEVEL